MSNNSEQTEIIRYPGNLIPGLSVPGGISPTLLPRVEPAMSDEEANRIIEESAEQSRQIAARRGKSCIAEAIENCMSKIEINTGQDARQIAARRGKSCIAEAIENCMSKIEINTGQDARQKRIEIIQSRDRADACLRGRNLPERFVDARLGDLSRIPADTLVVYSAAMNRLVVAQRKPGIYALCGAIGDGKTHLSAMLINAFCAAGRSAKYYKTADYVRDYRANWKSESGSAEARFEAMHVRLSLLVLDEWQVRGGTENENLILLRLLDKRYDAGKTTVLISNHLTKEGFTESIDARVADRLCDGGGVIMCNWASLRGRINT